MMHRLFRFTFLLCLVALIAGLSTLFPIGIARAERPDAPKYAKRGPYFVGTHEVVIRDTGTGSRPLTGTIWYPALKPDGTPSPAVYTDGLLSGTGTAVRDIAPDSAHGPYPLIVYSHGLSSLRFQSVFYVEHLVSYGFVVIAVDHPGSTIFDTSQDTVIATVAYRPLEVLREIAFAETLTAKDGFLAGIIDMGTIGLTGHSLGGFTVLGAAGARLDFDGLAEWCANNPPDMSQPETPCAFLKNADKIAAFRGMTAPPKGLWPATTDPRIKAVLAQAPAITPLYGPNGLATLTIPTMIEVGTKDRAAIPERDAYPAYDELGSDSKTLITFENAGHYIFVEKCTPTALAFGLFGVCSDLVWDMDRAHDLIDHFSAAFFLATLKHDPDAAKALSPASVDFVGIAYKTTNK